MITDTMLSLYIITSDNTGAVFNLEPTPGTTYRIGRSRDCEIAMPEEIHLSRIHCILTVGDGYALLTDNNSSNGIFEDDVRKPEILMMPGKQYRAGNCKITLEYTPDEAPAEYTETPEYTATPVEEPVVYDAPAAEEYTYNEPAPTVEEATAEPQEAPAVETEVYIEEVAEPQPEVEEYAEAPEEPETTAPEYTEAADEPPAPVEPAVYTTVEEPTRKTFVPPVIPRRKFVAPPPRKALVKRAAPRPFYTAAGTLSTETTLAAPKQLKRRAGAHGEKVHREPSQSAEAWGLPNDFELSLRLLNTTPTLEEGDLLRFAIRANTDCYVYLIQYDSENNAMMLVPGVGGASNAVQAYTELQFPPSGKDSKYELYVEQPYGRDTIIAVACTHPGHFAAMWKEAKKQADSFSRPGEIEQTAIEFCKEEETSEVRWSSAILFVHTGA